MFNLPKGTIETRSKLCTVTHYCNLTKDSVLLYTEWLNINKSFANNVRYHVALVE